MAEYIERESLQAALVRKQCGPANKRYIEGWNDCLMRVKSMVSNATAEDVAPVVHGRWVPFHSTHAGDIQYCSACGIGNMAKSDYCPHCGAKMDGGGADD